ncbi:hypothetical protein [Thalassobellus citreus]|uniref:hypothetical protein n=1 Tax=Thalassobellus citreus TaxID=3367752 RepID=UPI0037A2C8D3
MPMRIFKKKYKVDYENLISKLEIGNEVEIRELLWKPKNKAVEYLPNTTELVKKLKKEKTADQLKIHKKLEKGRFELLVFEITWTESDVPYSPIIIDKSNSKIVGVMLPFNELIPHLTNKENKEIGSLGIEWTSFVIGYRTGK